MQPHSAIAVQDGGAAFLVVDRNKMRKGTTERHEIKQQALSGTGENIDCRWAPTGIGKLWVSLPKQGVAMATISRRITSIICEHKLQGITIKRRNSNNGYTTPYEIYHIWSTEGDQDTLRFRSLGEEVLDNDVQQEVPTVDGL